MSMTGVWNATVVRWYREVYQRIARCSCREDVYSWNALFGSVHPDTCRVCKYRISLL